MTSAAGVGIKRLDSRQRRRAPAQPSCGGTCSGALSPRSCNTAKADMKCVRVAPLLLLLLVLHLLTSQVSSASLPLQLARLHHTKPYDSLSPLVPKVAGVLF